MKMSKSVGQNTLIKSKEKQEHATIVITGIKESRFHGDDRLRANLLMDQKEKQSNLLKEAKPVIKVSNQGKYLTHPLATGLNVNLLGTGVPDESHMLTEIVQVPKPEINFTIDHHDIINSMTRLMHLSCPRKSEIITGNQGISQEEHKNRTELSKEGDHTNQDRKLQERQPPNQTCPRKNIILHHAKASKEAMEEKGHDQNLEATLSQQSVALQKLQIKIAQLEKRNQAQGQ
ncbi:hypothetical protein F2Q69_00061217 [Brassica cretica]|uniref:Uncharacterized protein n=1 Tax=Brassica cretica TaxID=69181 RepID=A0A8S9RSZ6_BRACR|nr:hypothetical protein F2Q69_00061217 [Brassica cretica]